MNIHQFDVKDIKGNLLSLETFKGKVLLIVNVASRCGFTPQYQGLEELYQRYKERGFVILGFPSNDFLGQEPGSDAEIAQFCEINFGVTFPLFSKISVKGKEKDPLYRYLTGDDFKHRFRGRITWNFNKFLIGADGEIAARFPTRTKPLAPKMIKAVESSLSDL